MRKIRVERQTAYILEHRKGVEAWGRCTDTDMGTTVHGHVKHTPTDIGTGTWVKVDVVSIKLVTMVEKQSMLPRY